MTSGCLNVVNKQRKKNYKKTLWLPKKIYIKQSKTGNCFEFVGGVI